eukprot:scaffold64606_cov23-Prasinocladus_malaysianus.AAC.1
MVPHSRGFRVQATRTVVATRSSRYTRPSASQASAGVCRGVLVELRTKNKLVRAGKPTNLGRLNVEKTCET